MLARNYGAGCYGGVWSGRLARFRPGSREGFHCPGCAHAYFSARLAERLEEEDLPLLSDLQSLWLLLVLGASPRITPSAPYRPSPSSIYARQHDEAAWHALLWFLAEHAEVSGR